MRARAPAGPDVVGVDIGLSVTDAVLVPPDGAVQGPSHTRFESAGLEPSEALTRALEALGPRASEAAAIGVTGGRSGTLSADANRPPQGGSERVPLHVIGEPEAIGRGGLHLAGVPRALVVSCGTGTAMIAADAPSERYAHASGTPVGGGTLRALGGLLLGTRDAHAIAELAAAGDASAVDTTLADVLGAGIGSLPPDATAVSLGRLAESDLDVRLEDLAAAVVTMIAQTIGLVAVNAVRAQALPAVVMVGRLATFEPVRSMVGAVFRVYGSSELLHLPDRAERATAFGAALAAREREGRRREGDRREGGERRSQAP